MMQSFITDKQHILTCPCPYVNQCQGVLTMNIFYIMHHKAWHAKFSVVRDNILKQRMQEKYI